MYFLIAIGISLAFLVSIILLHEFLWLVWYRVKAARFKCSPPPYVEKSFPLGLTLMKRMGELHRSHQLLTTLTKEYFDRGSMRTSLRQKPLQYQIFTLEPENIKTVLATNFNDYSLGVRQMQLTPVFGEGIFTLSGGGWKHSRAMLRPQFSKEQIGRIKQLSDHAQVLVSAIESEQSITKWVDVQRYFHLYTMDTATEFLFGESIDSLNTSKVSSIVTRNGVTLSSEDFVKSYTFLSNYAFQRAILGKLYWLKHSREFIHHRKIAREFIDYYVDRALKATAFESEDIKAYGKPQIYVFAIELAKTTRDPITIRDQIFNILIAGRDTTASTLSFAIYFLARNPRIFNTLREEVLDFFGTEEEERPITFESLKKAPYLKNFINEVLRLAPVVPLNFRQAVCDTKLPTGGGSDGSKPVFVPKGCSVCYSVFMMHRDPKIWGKDANEFRPERWDNLKLDNLWAFLPFNGGPRICLGQQFALTEIALTLTRLLQKYSNIQASPQLPQEPRLANALTMFNAPPGVLVRFVKDS